MKLHQLLSETSGLETIASQTPPTLSRQEISHITLNSQQVNAHTAFAAMQGSRQDGHDFIKDAIQAQAPCILGHKPPHQIPENFRSHYIYIADLPLVLGKLLSTLYQNPSHTLKMAAVTGTNGKSTATYIIHHLLNFNGFLCGLIGTIAYYSPWLPERISKIIGKGLTTPDAPTLQHMLFEMKKNGASHVVSEVTSHSLAQGRVSGCHWDAAAFTNLTRDHLDYHLTMEEYYQAKKKLFFQLNDSNKKSKAALINTDDPFGKRLYQELSNELPQLNLWSGGLNQGDFHYLDIRQDHQFSFGKLLTPFESFEFKAPFIGHHNHANIITACGMAVALGLSASQIQEALVNAPQVPGRLQRISNPQGITAIVDYAHTPDGLERLFEAILSLKSGKIITVFGCGGDRDRGKRPLMGQCVAQNSHIAIVTSDNPRYEDPQQIIDDILPGMTASSCQIHIEPNRKKAILQAVELAQAGDCIVCVGKGHEDYQLVAGQVLPFSDSQTLDDALNPTA